MITFYWLRVWIWKSIILFNSNHCLEATSIWQINLSALLRPTYQTSDHPQRFLSKGALHLRRAKNANKYRVRRKQHQRAAEKNVISGQLRNQTIFWEKQDHKECRVILQWTAISHRYTVSTAHSPGGNFRVVSKWEVLELTTSQLTRRDNWTCFSVNIS